MNSCVKYHSFKKKSLNIQINENHKVDANTYSYVKCFTNNKLFAFFLPIFQMGKLTHRRKKVLGQGHAIDVLLPYKHAVS